METKKLAAFLLGSAMAVSLAASGCGGDEEKPPEGSQEPYTVAIQVVTMPGQENPGIQAREEAINAITVPAINCKVDIQEIWISELALKTSMAVVGDEKIDLVHVGTVQPLSTMAGSDMLYDMNTGRLLETHGQDIIRIFGEEKIACGEVNGAQLAVPARKYCASEKGVYYNKTFADEHAIAVSEEMTLDEFTGLLERVHEADPGIYPFYMGDGTGEYLYYFRGYESFDNNAAYGVILDTQERKIENLYASDIFWDYAKTVWEWKQKGLQPGDPTDTTVYSDYFKSGKLFAGAMDLNEQTKGSVVAANPEMEVGFIRMADPMITNTSVVEYMWGIAINSRQPEKAMDFLNFIYANKEVADILAYGLENENYTFAEGSDKIIKTNGTYYATFFRGGDPEKLYIKYPAGDDYMEKCEAMEEEAEISPMLGYIFDDSGIQAESAVVHATILEYLPMISCGMCESEEELERILEEFNGKLEAAGINRIIAENQRQMEEFLKD